MRMDREIFDYYDTEVIRRIVEKFGYDEKEAGSLFLSSKTYAKLANPEMGRWQFGPDGIFDMWARNASAVRHPNENFSEGFGQ